MKPSNDKVNPEDHLYGEETTIESEMMKDIDDLLDLDLYDV